jgi:uncharacterized Ntn-hydrolase superfamily protein
MTWSIVARDEASGAMGVAVSTKFFAVGARVPAIEVGAGAMASQALTNPLHRRRGLALLREGVPAQDVIRLLDEPDTGREHRQIHIMDREGRLAAHTGAECVPWCGHLIRDTFSVAGNMLAGPEVIADTARAYEAQAALPFPRRLIAALRAGEAAGGDKRGKQAAALLIYSTEEYSDLDLRVDDHTDPLAELERLEGVSRERWTHFRRFLPNRNDPSGVFDRDVINTEIEKALAAERERDA